MENKIENYSIKLSWGVTGFLQVFLPICQAVGREILPTRYKTMYTHRRASLRPQEGPTDQYWPQNHQNDCSNRSLDILTVFVPVGTFLTAGILYRKSYGRIYCSKPYSVSLLDNVRSRNHPVQSSTPKGAILRSFGS